MSETTIMWIAFAIVFGVMLAVDLGLTGRVTRSPFARHLPGARSGSPMGLRALYFLLANVMGMFVYLKFGISFILLFVGVKMLAGVSGFHIPITVSLAVIVVSLAVAVIASLMFGGNRRDHALESV